MNRKTVLDLIPFFITSVVAFSTTLMLGLFLGWHPPHEEEDFVSIMIPLEEPFEVTASGGDPELQLPNDVIKLEEFVTPTVIDSSAEDEIRIVDGIDGAQLLICIDGKCECADGTRYVSNDNYEGCAAYAVPSEGVVIPTEPVITFPSAAPSSFSIDLVDPSRPELGLQFTTDAGEHLLTFDQGPDDHDAVAAWAMPGPAGWMVAVYYDGALMWSQEIDERRSREEISDAIDTLAWP